MSGGKRKRSGRGVEELWRRELGLIRPRSFAYRVGASEDLIRRLAIQRKLDKHRGCVNTVSFNAKGDILVSGSDDKMVTLWNWDSGSVKFSFHTGHRSNVFQAKFMPFANDQSIVTCAADGQIRHAQLQEGGRVEVVKLGSHGGRAHKLAIEPGSPYNLYTCGEDGLVQHFDLRTRRATKLFFCLPVRNKSANKRIIGLNAISINPRNPIYFSVGGSDEYARLYDIRKCEWNGCYESDHPADLFCPRHLVGMNKMSITGLSFSEQSELLVSYSDEFIYLFSKGTGLGSDPQSKSLYPIYYSSISSSSDSELCLYPDGHAPQKYIGHSNRHTVKGVNFCGPYSEYVVSGSDCGRIFIWRKQDGELLRAMEGDKNVVNCIEPHPHDTVLASCGLEYDVKLWTPKASEISTLPVNVDEGVKSDGIHGFAFYYDSDDDEEDDFDFEYNDLNFSDDEDIEDEDDNDDDGSDPIIMVDAHDDDDNTSDDGNDNVEEHNSHVGNGNGDLNFYDASDEW